MLNPGPVDVTGITSSVEGEPGAHHLIVCPTGCMTRGKMHPCELYDQKLSELRTLTGALYRRVRENQERPEALAVLHSMINSSTNFLAGARNVTAQAPEGGMFTPVELDTLDRVIKETKVCWFLCENRDLELTLM
uniref:Uncharacterized protein n=1 Tax=Timema bartmani TaxID=61472 RepID=A0A7R9HXU4_9NEOP|nr:unnamed protein product [Timema bartmani]